MEGIYISKHDIVMSLLWNKIYYSFVKGDQRPYRLVL